MLFNSFEFAVFFTLVLIGYWSLPWRGQNVLLFIADFVFYGFWDWRFLLLLTISITLDYACALLVRERLDSGRKRAARVWVTVSICGNLAILCFFKYFNFFIDSFISTLDALGIPVPRVYLHIILPAGISFYTFQSLSYSVDVYRGLVLPTRNYIHYAIFHSFFPQLVAGPISRAKDLLTQVAKPRGFDKQQFMDGLSIIFLGLFMKIFVADNLAPIVDKIYSGQSASSLDIVLATVAFSFQIYCDFAGYSNIARGCAKCLGFDLVVNFNYPYFSENIQAFWRRWHISLSSWLRDFVYIPLGGNRFGAWLTYRNLAATMLLCGLWHGASWTFVLWGAYHGVLLMGYRFFTDKQKPSEAKSGALSLSIKYLTTFALATFGWMFFRSQSLDNLSRLLGDLFASTQSAHILDPLAISCYIIPILLLEIGQVRFNQKHSLNRLRFPKPFNVVILAVMFYMMAFHGATSQSFIYFQF